MAVRKWTRDETLIALNLYCKIPFKDSHSYHPLVIEYARLLDGRTPSALNLKIGNLGRFDEKLRARGITGLANGSKLDEQVWREFEANPEAVIYESEQIFARRRGQDMSQAAGFDEDDLPDGAEREVTVRQRVSQRFFREAVLSAYLGKCCITGIDRRELLEACHISSWAGDTRNRTNPRNGLCMNPLFHKAFDEGLFAVSPDYLIDISEPMVTSATDETFRTYLLEINHRQIGLPEKFLPDRDLLAKRYEHYRKFA